MDIRLLTEYHLEFLCLTGGCTSSSESTLVKMPHCWKSHVAFRIITYPYVHAHSCILFHYSNGPEHRNSVHFAQWSSKGQDKPVLTHRLTRAFTAYTQDAVESRKFEVLGTRGFISKLYNPKIIIIIVFLPNICFWCVKETFHEDISICYTQYRFTVRLK